MKVLWRGKFRELSDLEKDPDYIETRARLRNEDREQTRSLARGLEELRGHEDEPA